MDPAPAADLSAAYNSRAHFSAMIRQEIEKSARSAGDDNDVWLSADSMIRSINDRLRAAVPPVPVWRFEWDMHDLWYMYYHAAMNTSDQSPKQDRLALQVLQTQHLGAPTSSSSGPGSPEAGAVVTSEGTIWTDLPFLVSDMTEYWLKDCASMGAVRRLNYTRFLANLASIRTADDRLCGIALVTLRDALETKRQLGSLDEDGQQGEDPSRTMDSVSIASLLHSVNTWLFVCGPRMIHLSEEGWSSCPPALGQVGELAQQAEVEMPGEGFSVERWIFWLQRLQEIKADAAGHGDGALADVCGRMSDNMLFTAEDIGTSIRQSLHGMAEPVGYHRKPEVFASPAGAQDSVPIH